MMPARRTIPPKWKKLFKLIPGYDPVKTADKGDWFDVDAAEDACEFFPECLKHVEGDVAGQPFRLEPWQQAVIGCAFGWKRKDLKGRTVRRYRTLYIYVPRKNGKTPLAAGIALLLLFCDNEAGAQIYTAACERQQAALIYRHAAGMVESEPELDDRGRVYKGHKSIVRRDDALSSLQVLSAEASSKHGQNPHAVLIDELHSFGDDRELVDTLTTGFASENRSQPMLVYTTTADYLRESIGNEKYEYAARVRDGAVKDSRFLPVIFEAGPNDDWKSEKVWAKANPNLGVSVSLEYLRAACREAQEVPALENAFRRLHLNQRTESDVRWISLDAWDACDGALGDLSGRPCYAGLDLASTSDLCALVLVFPSPDEPWDILPFFWCSEDTAAKRDRQAVTPYSMWARQGHMELTPGASTDYDVMRRRINEISRQYRVVEIAADVKFQGLQFCQDLLKDGLTVLEHGQGHLSMAAPCKRLTEMVLSRQIRHAGHPVLRWNAGNVATKEDEAGNIKFDKKRSSDKIDGVVALAMGIGRAMIADDGGCSYDNDGVMVI